MNDSSKIVLRSFLAGFIALILFFSTPASAIAFADTQNPNTNPLTGSGFTVGDTASTAPQTNNLPTSTQGAVTGACVASTLSPSEAQNILSLTHDGFNAKNISSGNDSNSKSEVKEYGTTTLVGQALDQNTAIAKEAPTTTVGADKFAFFSGKSFNGPFGVGFVLDDTIRIGRCDYPAQEQQLCKINGNGLYMRTSGNSVKSDFVNALAAAESAVGGSNKNLAEKSLSPEDYNALKNNYLALDANDFQTGSFAYSDSVIQNHLSTASFTAKNSTTCNNNACTISTYSAFDKFFNAWYTIDMVVSNVGPTLLNKSMKLLTKGAKFFGNGSAPNKFFWDVPQKVKDAIVPPGAFFPDSRAQLYGNLIKREGFDSVLEPLTIGRKLFSTDGGGAVPKLIAKESEIWKYAPEKRKNFYKAISYLRGYARANVDTFAKARVDYDAAIAAANLLADPAAKAAALKAAKVTYGRKAALAFDDWDEKIALDTEQWLQGAEDLFQFGGIAIRKNGPFPEGQGYVDITTGQAFNVKRMLQTFGNDGDWSKWANSADAETFTALTDGSLKLYKLEPKKLFKENASLDELKAHLARTGTGTYSVKMPDGRYYPLSADTISVIEKNPTVPGSVNIYESAYVEAGALTPEDFANRLTDARIVGRPKTALRNLDTINTALVSNDYAPRPYMSILDQQFANEGDLINSYFKNPLKVGLYKGLVLPVAYWDFKQGFANYTGQEQYSAFLLPDTWSSIIIYQGSDQIYKDAFIDFYANAGSDQGDMFKRAFNSIPLVWTNIVEQVASTNDYTKDMLARASGGFFDGPTTRDTVGDIALYSHNENCADCAGSFNYKDGHLTLDAKAGTSLQAFIVEAKVPEDKEKQGSLLVAYTHHSNLQGKTGQISGEKIDISDARREETTCDQVLRKFHLGWAGPAAGGIVAAGESLVYFAGFGPGLAASLLQQIAIGRNLQDCVDDVEGYYVHFFAPPSKDAAKTKSQGALSNESISDTLSDMSSKISDFVKNSDSLQPSKEKEPTNPIEKSLDKLKTQFQDFADKAKQANILQAAVELMPPSEGRLTSKEVFYIWFKGNSMPAGYRTTGKEVLTDGNKSLEFDLANGTLKLNNKTILGPEKADHVRLAATDTRIPAQVIPATLNKTAIPMNSDPVFEMNNYGEIRVVNAYILDCIQRAIKDQSGITYSGNELTQVFGKLDKMTTQNFGAVFARDGRIIVQGTTSLQGGFSSHFIIDGFMNSKLVDGNTFAEGGKFVGMNFEHGVIVYKPETNELIIWLRQHKDAVLTNKEVKGLTATPTTIVDANTGCDVPALKLAAIPYANDDLGAQKVENFNTSMEKLGPFTQFVTDKRIYEFYTIRDPVSGECKKYFRVRDKDTGKIITDQEIIGDIKRNEDGTITFTTADGKNHSLKFDAENGVPKLSYDGGPPETLLSAQGPKGSFWYDPNTGLWYPENGLQVPLNQNFKDNGAWFSPDKNGNVTGTPENKMTFNIGNDGQSGFNLPSMPETAAGIAVFILAFLGMAYALTYARIGARKRSRK